MKAVVAIDSMKGSLTSLEAGEAIRAGICRAVPDAEVQVRPLADGGEGTVEAMICGAGGELENIEVTGPDGKRIRADYGILKDGTTAVIEMSAAAGITLVASEALNPMVMTTYGVGEMILDAIQKGCRHFIIGIGGSATNDGGIGMLQALGFGILDEAGNPVPFGAQGLEKIAAVTDANANALLKECDFCVACDVTNPLCGEKGCSAVFGPQKGADPEMIRRMDQWMKHYTDLTRRLYPEADPDIPGSGAAGGLGYALTSYLNAKLESGISIVLRETKLETYIRDADIVITGEGRLDGQTVMGKAPIGVARLAKQFGKPVIAFSGVVTEDAAVCNEHGIDAFFPILRRVVTSAEAKRAETAKQNLTDTTEQVFRLIAAVRAAVR